MAAASESLLVSLDSESVQLIQVTISDIISPWLVASAAMIGFIIALLVILILSNAHR